MNLGDATGHRVSGTSAKSLASYEQAVKELLCMVDDPAATVAGAGGQSRHEHGACAEGLAPREGIAWLEPTRDIWSKGSFLGTHNT
jgi:hypothetical protein